MRNGYIACLDSGIGGISVLVAAKRLLPEEDFLYYGDVKNAPYGDKSTDEVHEIVLNNINYLLTWDIKALVLACNTATSASVQQLRNLLDIPILGVEPALKPAVKESLGRIIVLGTELTLREKKFEQLLSKMGTAKDIVPLACPGLMELVEDDPRKPEVGKYLQKVLEPYKDNLGAIVLGCTHYVFLRPWLIKLFPDTMIFDGNDGVAKQLAKVLTEEELLGGTGQIMWLSSLKDEEERELFTGKCWEFYDYYAKSF